MPYSSGSAGNGSALIVFSDLHGSSVLLVLNSFDSQDVQLLIFQWVKSPVGTDTENVILFFETSVCTIVIGNKTSLVCWDGSKTESWQLSHWDTEFFISTSCMLDSIVVFSSGISEWVVVRWPVLVEVNCVGICLYYRYGVRLGSTIWNHFGHRLPYDRWWGLAALRMGSLRRRLFW